MIVVIGQPWLRLSSGRAAVDGHPARIAMAAAGRGRSVQLVGKVGEDAAGDVVVQALARGGVGHAALLRDAGILTPTVSVKIDELDLPDDAPEVEPASEAASGDSGASLGAADLDLGLRYLLEFAVLVLAEPVTADALQVVAGAAAWGKTHLIVVVEPGTEVPAGLPAEAIVFEAPDRLGDDAFAVMVGTFAAALDGGEAPAEAFRSSMEADGWSASPGG